MHELELTLTAAATAPGAARKAVLQWLADRHCDQDTLDTAQLLATELVTNAVVHATGSRICLTIDEMAPDLLHVAVRDGSDATPRRPLRVPDATDPGGRGLFLVENLADAWGWEPLRTGKRVWFELPCPAGV